MWPLVGRGSVTKVSVDFCPQERGSWLAENFVTEPRVSLIFWQNELTVTWGQAGTINVAGSGRVCVFMK